MTIRSVIKTLEIGESLAMNEHNWAGKDRDTWGKVSTLGGRAATIDSSGHL